MGIQSNNRVIGILANVDSGKTTLAEAMLYQAGAIRKQGRVDHGDAFLDSGIMERQRGITIFSKLARLDLPNGHLILLDTPGHADFTPETERALSVLDYCVLVINGADGVTAQTRRLWELLKIYGVPVILFVNKIDQESVEPLKVYQALRKDLSEQVIDFADEKLLESEELATINEELIEEFLRAGSLAEDSIRQSILKRQIFPCFFGSALKNLRVDSFLKALDSWTLAPSYPESFSAQVYKISRVDQQRLTYLRITGGSLKNKSLIGDEKINEIRLYSGTAYENVQEALAGEICAVTGLKSTWAGQKIGDDQMEQEPLVFPVLTYRVQLEEGGDEAKLISLLQEISEELPDLDVSFDHETSSIFVHIMGDILIEVLEKLVEERGQMKISMDEGSIVYKETVLEPVLGIGHFEPLRHYAEVHLLIEPSKEPGISYHSQCSDNSLMVSRQQQILQDLKLLAPPGVLLGAGLSHIKITLINGREHDKHTQGGDLREAAIRALRQGLMIAREKNKTRLLEPFYDFEIKTDQVSVGRIMTDLNRLGASDILARPLEEGMLVIGSGPVRTLRTYQREILSVTKGQAKLRFDFGGYKPSSAQREILQGFSYDPERDQAFPTGSVFCAQGAGFYVPWDQVAGRAHIPLPTSSAGDVSSQKGVAPKVATTMGSEEVEKIIQQTFYANANEKKQWRKRKPFKKTESKPTSTVRGQQKGPTYLLVDGYNVIHAWPELAELAAVNFAAAREKLIDVLHDYQSFTEEQVVIVFDAWKVVGGRGSREERDNLFVVFTKEHETADHYIERRAMELVEHHPVKVVTSDTIEQRLTSGSGALVYSAGRFQEVLAEVGAQIWEEYRRGTAPDHPFYPMSELGKLRERKTKEVDATKQGEENEASQREKD